MLLAPLAEFLKLQPGLQGLFILLGKIIDPFALGAFELDHVVLGHNGLLMFTLIY
jgi:hypothetical protein